MSFSSQQLSKIQLLLVLTALSAGRLGSQVTTEHRTLVAATTITPPYLTYQNALITIRFDTTHAFRLLQEILDDSASPEGVRERYRPQLDSARAAILGGAPSWRLSDDYVVDDLLQNAPFEAIDRRTRQRVNHLDMEDYNEHCGMLCGRGEHRFRLPDGRLFLKLLMWVS